MTTDEKHLHSVADVLFAGRRSLLIELREWALECKAKAQAETTDAPTVALRNYKDGLRDAFIEGMDQVVKKLDAINDKEPERLQRLLDQAIDELEREDPVNGT